MFSIEGEAERVEVEDEDIDGYWHLSTGCVLRHSLYRSCSCRQEELR